MSSLAALLLLIFASITVATGEMNCSTYNPCGKYGYCVDGQRGVTKCVCKFWWNGTLCDQQTNSGTQVIVLGCLLGLLLLIFFGMKIFLVIRDKRKRKRLQPKAEKKKEIVQDAKLATLAYQTARQTARFSSCVTALLVLILASAMLVAKWSIIQPIHNQIVYQYQNNQSIYYTPNAICNLLDDQRFNLLTFPVACFLILVFIIRTKRTSFMRDKCYGYIAPPMPLDFIAHMDRKIAIVVFAVCADELLNIITSAFSGTTNASLGVILSFLSRLLQVLIMGFRYYPILAAVYINSILSLALATLYAWLDYSMTVVDLSMCQSDFYPTYEDFQNQDSLSIDSMFEYYGTGPNLIAIQLCTDIPRFVCLAFLSVKIPLLLINKIVHRFKKNVSFEKRMIRKLTREEKFFFYVMDPTSAEMLYVKNLFHSTDERPRTKKLIGRLIPKFIYEWRDDFRFSTRVLCVYSTILMVLYNTAIQAFVQVLPILNKLQEVIQLVANLFSTLYVTLVENANSDPNVDTDYSDYGTQDYENETVFETSTDPSPADMESYFPIPSLTRPYICAVFLTLVIIAIQLCVLLVNVRRNLLQAFRGDDCEIPRRQRSRYTSYAAGNFHFAGYLIGYLIWGFLLITVFSFIICISIDAFITYGSVRVIESILKKIIPSLLFIFFKQYLNRLLAQYAFLQHYGEVLSLNNRRVLMIFLYFNFYLDAFLGFVSSIIRLVKSVIGGIIYMCRMDYSPLGRKLETFDGGFSSYCGFIHTECVHRHPVMLVFASHLYTQFKVRKLAIESNQVFAGVKVSSRFARKWKLAVFLIRNPTIVYFRKAFLNQLHMEEIQALNDVDNDDKKTFQKRLSIYARRMSAARLSAVSDDLKEELKQWRF